MPLSLFNRCIVGQIKPNPMRLCRSGDFKRITLAKESAASLFNFVSIDQERAMKKPQPAKGVCKVLEAIATSAAG